MKVLKVNYIFVVNAQSNPIGVKNEVLDLECDDNVEQSSQIHLYTHGTLNLGIFHHFVRIQSLQLKDMNLAYLLRDHIMQNYIISFILCKIMQAIIILLCTL